MSYKILFLVPIFESIDCVEDLIQNINTICPNSAILFHVNVNSGNTYLEAVNHLLEFYKNCFLFPKQFPSDWGHGFLATIYCNMMEYALENIDFEYIYFTASNSLLINPNLEKEVNQYDVYFWDSGPKSDGDWWEYIKEDKNLFLYASKYDKTIYCSIIEGLCFNGAVAKDFVDELAPFLNYERVNYPTEEYWFATAFKHIKHKYKHLNKNLERWAHGTDHAMVEFSLDVKSVEEFVINLILEDNYDILSYMNLYSLKKIERKYNNDFRRMLRSHHGYYNQLF